MTHGVYTQKYENSPIRSMLTVNLLPRFLSFYLNINELGLKNCYPIFFISTKKRTIFACRI